MTPKVNEAAWLLMVDETIEAVLEGASTCRRGSPEWDALSSEPSYLRQMRDEVRQKPPGQRGAISSRLVSLAAREHLDIPTEILDQVARVSGLYGRWANRPEWQDG